MKEITKCEECPDFSCDYMKEVGFCDTYGNPARRTDSVCGAREFSHLEKENDKNATVLETRI